MSILRVKEFKGQGDALLNDMDRRYILRCQEIICFPIAAIMDVLKMVYQIETDKATFIQDFGSNIS